MRNSVFRLSDHALGKQGNKASSVALGLFLPSPFRNLFGNPPWQFITLVLAELARLSLSIFPSFSLGILIDTVFATKSIANLTMLMAVLVVSHTLEIVVSRLVMKRTTAVCRDRDNKLIAMLLSYLDEASLHALESKTPSMIYNRFNSIRRIVNFFVNWYVSIVAKPIFLLVAFGWLLFENFVLGVVILAMTAMHIYLYWIASLKLKLQYIEDVKQLEEKTNALQDFAHGLLTLGISGKILDFYHSKTVDHEKNVILAKRDISRLIIVQFAESYSRLAYIVVLGIGALLVIRGHLTIGHLVIINVIFRRVLSETRYIISRIRRYYRTRTLTEAISRFVDDLQVTPSPVGKLGTLPSFEKILLDEIAFCYPSAQTPILKGVNLEIERGKFVVFLGASGSGKTSLLKIIARLYVPTSGSLNYFKGGDTPLRFSFISSADTIFNLTLHENIAFHNSVSREDVIDAAKNAGAHGFIEKLEFGYDTKLKNFGRSLSQGQKLSVLIARCFASNADVLFLDEPTCALDPHSELRFLECLRTAKVGKTILMVTHRRAPAMAADTVVFVEGGRLIETGSPAKLLNDSSSAFFQWYNTDAGQVRPQNASPLTAVLDR